MNERVIKTKTRYVFAPRVSTFASFFGSESLFVTHGHLHADARMTVWSILALDSYSFGVYI